MSRAKGEALNNLKLDAAFFQRILRKEANSEDSIAPDYDLYLMEKNLMPLLLQGLDALSRQVEKEKASETEAKEGGFVSEKRRMPFNPLTWLAQYLLRNHPGKVKDHRSAIYQRLMELAAIERGRRTLLRRRAEMEHCWQDITKDKGGRMTLEELPTYFKRLDDAWHLQGAFNQKLPADLKSEIARPDSSAFPFDDFWEWFAPYVEQHDVLRATEFEDAERRQLDKERHAMEASEELKRRERAVHEVLENRRILEEQFANISADFYTDDIITQIVNKGAVIDGLEEQEGGVPLQGVHIALIVNMLQLWGFECSPVPEDRWDESCRGAWRSWVEEYGPARAEPQVNSQNLRQLMDLDVFASYMKKRYPAPDADETLEIHQTVHVQTLVEGDDIDVFVEALDEETGEMRQLFLPPNQVEEVRRRLAEGDEPVLASVDLMSQRVLSVQPARNHFN